MSLYERYVLPHVIHLACGNEVIGRQRAKVVPAARGRVLEVGFGSGLNLGHYDAAQIERVWALEPSEGMRQKAGPRLTEAPFPVEWLDLPGEEIPLEDASMDTVLLTYTLCTIPDWARALEQMRRVLKPGGTLLFCEHGLAPDESARKWQDRINPVWRRLAGGCNVNRPIPELIRTAGFAIERMETAYLPKSPHFAGFNYWGSAAPRK